MNSAPLPDYNGTLFELLELSWTGIVEREMKFEGRLHSRIILVGVYPITKNVRGTKMNIRLLCLHKGLGV